MLEYHGPMEMIILAAIEVIISKVVMLVIVAIVTNVIIWAGGEKEHNQRQ